MYVSQLKQSFVAVAVCMIVAALPAHAEVVRPAVLDRPARQVAQPEQAFLLGAARAGKRLVAVGEGGRIVLSDDSGKTWRQAKVPASVMLTDVVFANERVGWAVGHLGVVMRTTDGGESWVRQLDGIQAADLVLQAARQRVTQDADEASEQALRQAEFLVQDGPDKPFLALRVESPERAIVLGAFGYALLTEDGGRHWRTVSSRFDNPTGMHYYDIAGEGGVTVVVGEQGLALRATADGNYRPVEQPYEGTLFGIRAIPGGVFIAYGLRGNIVRSEDHGQTWQQVDSGVPASIQAGTVLADGTVLLAAESGQLLASRDSGRNFSLLEERAQPAADLVQLTANDLLVVGPRGTQVISLAARK